jgi:hypothetical protein
MKKFLNTKRKIAALAIGGAVVVGSTIGAYAFWTTNGSGTGSASTGTNTALTISQDGTVSNLVLGDGTTNSQSVGFTIHNSATSPQQVSGVSFSIASITPAQSDTGKPACAVGDFVLTQPTWSAVEIPATGATAFDSTGAKIAMKDTAANQDNCKNVTVALAFSSN